MKRELLPGAVLTKTDSDSLDSVMGESASADAAGAGLTFWDHVMELRSRLVHSALFFAATFILAWVFRDILFNLVTYPIYVGLSKYGIGSLLAISSSEAMVVYLKLCLIAALTLSIPFLVYQIWAFVRPGLLESEIRPVRRIAVLSSFMFAIGGLFCYKFVLALLVEFLTDFTMESGNVDFMLSMESAYSTATMMLLAFGVIFELPLIMVLISNIPIITHKTYLKAWRYAIVISFVIGAIFTPPDVVSQILMSVPLVFLYFLGTLLTWLFHRRRKEARPSGRLDFGLVGLSTLLLGSVVALSWPVTSDPREYIPPAAILAVSHNGQGLALPCPGLPEVSHAQPSNDSLLRQACVRLPQGSFRLDSWPDSDSAAVHCAAVVNQNATGSRTDCATWNDWTITGNPTAIAVMAGILDSSLPIPGPMSGRVDGESTLIYTSTAEDQQRQTALAEFADGTVKIVLTASDRNAASVLASALGKNRPLSSSRMKEPDARLTRVDAALRDLAAAAEELAAEMDESSGPQWKSFGQASRTLRAALDDMPAESNPRLCTDEYCLLQNLDGLFAQPLAATSAGRNVMIEFEEAGTQRVLQWAGKQTW